MGSLVKYYYYYYYILFQPPPREHWTWGQAMQPVPLTLTVLQTLNSFSYNMKANLVIKK